ncbi:hypothetical protein FJQ98_10885 [Lysinibacillus agricola]|uniref:Uncharacterized protein n=1 Tax=Lysinibacillus agricola TaxID=2590012 RepID=A0ABX7AYB8_9BACI|nr:MULTISPECIES: hypothetical protein [Lysinibacillus]KOS60178.1 hypothetical protein AN161_24025 [Lysinibacillus sp. FJAT-14222]QQP14467.1 hypothetical protein FJQ98_10885 [Lysinibacillus agricola]
MGSLKMKIISILFIFAFVWIIMLLNAGPSKPIVMSESENIPILQGTYCWEKLIEVECVDKIPPTEIIANNKIVPFPVSPQSAIKINFKKQPIDEIEVEIENLGESKQVKVEGNVMFLLHQKRRGLIYSISGRWDKGSASYIFAIEVK